MERPRWWDTRNPIEYIYILTPSCIICIGGKGSTGTVVEVTGWSKQDSTSEVSV